MRTRGTRTIGLAVRFRLSPKTVALYRTRKSLPLAQPNNVHSIADGKHLNRQLVPFLDVLQVLDAKFPQIPQRRKTVALEVTELPAGETPWFDFAESNLNRTIPISFR
jgi:hypothetical protein